MYDEAMLQFQSPPGRLLLVISIAQIEILAASSSGANSGLLLGAGLVIMRYSSGMHIAPP